MKLATLRFGDIEVSDDKIVSFPAGIPGLEDNRRFVLLCFEESRPIAWLQSVDDTSIALPVLDPFLVMPGYSFDISSADIETMGLESQNDVHVVSILVIPEDVNAMTINLAAPVIIDVKHRTGMQILLEGGKYSVREPVYALIEARMKEVAPDAGAHKKAQ